MTLDKYKEKRNASKTPEPFGGKSGDKGELRFVIQKHAASHLHYDFRLEMEGVLKSWAVPKGPSTDPEIKRLAMMVEDHPYNYRTFEGIIPKGQYGGGTVIVWDEGTYEPLEFKGKTKKEKEKHLLHTLYSGKLKFSLNGKKLKGEFALVKANGRGENGWLLMKLDDKYASTSDITKKDTSVVSGKNIDEVAATSKNIYGKKNADPQQKIKKKVHEKEETPEAVKLEAETLLNKGKRSKSPTNLKPMLATLVSEPFEDPKWVYEVKWDGYRAMAYVQNGKVELSSRNNKSFTEKYYPIASAMKEWDIDLVLDGEILVMKSDGQADFSALQNWRSEADGDLVFYAFDLLWYEGKSIMHLPLVERQAILKEILPTNDDRVRLSQVFTANGLEFFEAAKRIGLEGIMAKHSDSSYVPDSRSKSWLKIKANKRQEVVIGGFTRNEGSSKQFSSLLLGVFEKDKLQYVGKVGTGFTEKLQHEMIEKFKPLVTKTNPFTFEPDVNKPSRFRPNPPKATATWLKPELVCEVSFTEVTSDGVFRHPSFEGMRSDKRANEVVREIETQTEKVVDKKEPTISKKDDIELISAPKDRERKTLLNPKEETQVKKINGRELKFTNLTKIFWEIEKITKRELINYYFQISPYIIPYLKDRPQSMNRFPNGITGESFYFKDVTGKAPEWVKTYLYHSDDGRDRKYLVGHNEATLLYMANLGCIEMNPWNSTVKKPDNPTFCIIDLDPGDKSTFEQVIETAQITKAILDDMGVPSYCKTSGSTGLHIYIPLGNKYSYEQSKEFGRIIATLVNRELPKTTSIERQISERKGKLYIDFLQNRPHATIACAYSVRPKPKATVSMPLEWDEVKKGLKMSDFHIYNALERVQSLGDIFLPVLEKGIDLKKIINDIISNKEKED